MLRRPPTTLTLTSEDIATYEDSRNRIGYIHNDNINSNDVQNAFLPRLPVAAPFYPTYAGTAAVSSHASNAPAPSPPGAAPQASMFRSPFNPINRPGHVTYMHAAPSAPSQEQHQYQEPAQDTTMDLVADDGISTGQQDDAVTYQTTPSPLRSPSPEDAEMVDYDMAGARQSIPSSARRHHPEPSITPPPLRRRRLQQQHERAERESLHSPPTPVRAAPGGARAATRQRMMMGAAGSGTGAETAQSQAQTSSGRGGAPLWNPEQQHAGGGGGGGGGGRGGASLRTQSQQTQADASSAEGRVTRSRDERIGISSQQTAAGQPRRGR